MKYFEINYVKRPYVVGFDVETVWISAISELAARVVFSANYPDCDIIRIKC